MSDAPRWRPEPGPDGYQQPKRKIVWRDDLPWREVSVLQGNPKDQGVAKRLVHPELNGSPDVEFFFGAARFEPGEYHPRHYHPNGGEFYYVLSGKAQILVDEEWVEASPGLAIYFSRGTSHAVRVTGDQPLDIVYGFHPPDLERVGTVWEE